MQGQDHRRRQTAACQRIGKSVCERLKRSGFIRTGKAYSLIRHALEPVAVIGASCRLPGGVDSVADFWDALRAGRDAVERVDNSRWDPVELALLQKDSSRPLAWYGGFLDGDISAFDAEFFGISSEEAERIDPQHRLLLEVAWEACEHAGLPVDSLPEIDASAFVGMCNPDHAAVSHWLPAGGGPYFVTGSQFGPAAGRLSHVLGLRGPSIAVDTACSSGLVTLHLAYQSLQMGECDLAFAGAVNLLVSPRTLAAYHELGVLSPTGQCRSFDEGASGYVRAEGCVVVVLKRLRDAVRDRDQVLAVLAGTAVNHDGRTSRFTLPSQEAQEKVFRTALARADADPAAVGMVEAHGSGTRAGDRIEFASLAEVYGQGHGRCALGSVKSNIGHTESAAGLVGFLKAVLAVQHGEVPASLHFDDWQSGIDSSGTRLYVPTQTEKWPVEGSPRLAAVCSYGVGGTNAHAVVTQAPPVQDHATPENDEALRVFLLSARSPSALPGTSGRLADWLAGPGSTVPLADVAHTLALRRSHADERLAVVARSRGELLTRLRAYAEGGLAQGVTDGFVRAAADRGPVWVFSGHGSQWPGMARALLDTEPVFASTIAELDPLVTAESGFSPYELLRSGSKVTRFDRVQPMIFAVQIALARTLRAHGVKPAAVVGHSMGEIAAAVTAGALSLADGVRVICRRSMLCLPQALAGSGAMAAVELPYEQVHAELAEIGAEADVAVITAPRSTVIGGVKADVRHMFDVWRERGVPTRMIDVDVGSHSRLVRPAAEKLAETLGELRPRRASVPFYSTVLDDPRDESAFDATYWAANLARPVQAATATAALVEDGYQIFLEISPHPISVRPLADTLSALGADESVALPSLHSGQDCAHRLWGALGALHCLGQPVPWQRWYGDGALADVPTNLWERRLHQPGRTAVHTVPAAETVVVPQESGPGESPEDRDLAAEMRAAPVAARQKLVEEQVARHLRVLLRLRKRRIHPTTVFSDLGLDSLLMVELRVRLERALQMPIPLDLLWKHPTVRDFSARLCEELPDTLRNAEI